MDEIVEWTLNRMPNSGSAVPERLGRTHNHMPIPGSVALEWFCRKGTKRPRLGPSFNTAMLARLCAMSAKGDDLLVICMAPEG